MKKSQGYFTSVAVYVLAKFDVVEILESNGPLNQD